MLQNKKRALATLLAASMATGMTVASAPAAYANGGTNSLASVLTAKNSYDSDGTNYDILTAAVLAVLTAKPQSPVGLLTDGTVDLTAFIPNDAAFTKLVTSLTGSAPANEQATFNAVAGLGIDTVESVLLYHVVPGTAIASSAALQANGATLTTALSGKTVGVTVVGTNITLGDYDPIAADPKVILSQVDINTGNKQLAHGIDSVLLPSALTPLGTNSLAAVLTAKNSFDKNGKNYDILTAAVLAVLQAKPTSPVSALTDGTVALTAFIPNDDAFKNLVRGLTRKMPKTEKAAFTTVASLGIPTVEKILLYHVVIGDAIKSEAALQADGASLQTALSGKQIRVRVTGTRIVLGDYKKVFRDARVLLTQVDINKNNKQLAHGINFVMLPNR